MACHNEVYSPYPFQHLHKRSEQQTIRTMSFICGDDICITAQYPTFLKAVYYIKGALGKLITYYSKNSLRANSEKTQITAFHLQNGGAKRSLAAVWNGIDPGNTPHPKYLDVIFDKALDYKQHMQNAKMKVATLNNLLKKLVNYRWETNSRTI